MPKDLSGVLFFIFSEIIITPDRKTKAQNIILNRIIKTKEVNITKVVVPL